MTMRKTIGQRRSVKDIPENVAQVVRILATAMQRLQKGAK